MVIDCYSQGRSCSTFYQSRMERELLGHIMTQFIVMKRIECNFARPFGHLLANDAISWTVLQMIKMNEDHTAIQVKIMMQEVTESMGLVTLNELFADPEIKALYIGMSPLDNPKNTRISINYFTSIGLGFLTKDMREHPKVS